MTIAATIIILIIAAVAAWIIISIKLWKKKTLRIYNNIQIGDWHECTFAALHSFDTPQHFSAEIIAKKLAGGKYPWVQYRFADGSVSQDELCTFLDLFHKKPCAYNGNDY